MNDQEKSKEELISELVGLREENKKFKILFDKDIQEIKQVESILKESEGRYRNLVDNALIGVSRSMVNGEVIYVNEAIVKMLEFDSREELISAGAFMRYKYPSQREEFIRMLKKDGMVNGFEASILTKKGNERVFLFSLLLNGDVIDGTLIDITERKETEDALRKSEKKWRKLVQTLPDYVALYDCDGKYLFLNRFAQGFSMKDIEGKTYSDFLADDFRLVYEEAFNMAKQTNSTQYVEHTALGDNRTIRNYESYFVPIFENDEFSNMMVIARDVTERKKTEEALKWNEAIFNQFLEYSPIYVFFKDENIRSLKLSRNYEKLLGKPIDELLGKTMNELFPSDVAEKMIEDDLQILHEGIKVEVIEEFNNRHFSTIKFPIQLEGKPKFLAGFTIDITDRLKAEQEIRESEERFRVLLQSVSSVSVQGYSPDGTTQYWNKASELLYGYTEQEAIGRNLLDLIIPLEMKEGAKQAIQQMDETGIPIPPSELSLMRKDGSRVSVISSHAIVQSLGKSQELFCIDIDLTDYKKAEEAILKSKQQFDNLVAQIPVGVYILRTKPDYSYALEYVSPVMAKILGLSVESLLAYNNTIFNAIHPEDLEEVAKLNLEGIKRKQPFDWKGRAIVKGVVKWLHMSSLPQQQENGDILWHGLIVDITEQIRDEEEIKKQNQKLQELNATKDKFFSIIAHDLRSPFNGFLGLTQIMAEELPSLTMAQIQEIAMDMSKSATNLYRLLENLLHWSSMQQGVIPFNPETVRLLPFADESITMILEPAKVKGIEINCTIPDDLVVFADTNLLQTIIRNLVSNAVKFTHKGGKVNLSAKIANDSNIEISVHDTGIGMSQVLLDNLFKLDVNTSRLGTNGEPSSGLGLLLCKEFIEKHGAQIWVESEVGKGSTFYFTLPRIKNH
ncbi:MAG: PAS domain-containing sensor histidine kinase [Prolixibacteraceae bacterium]|nr:PAS domain-containing sensor histidine kinase [Prolixibacteraceae bacterium]